METNIQGRMGHRVLISNKSLVQKKNKKIMCELPWYLVSLDFVAEMIQLIILRGLDGRGHFWAVLISSKRRATY